MILLRFRDISISDGETILQHGDVITNKGYVWWGWITRQEETFPKKLIVELSRGLDACNGQELMMVHTDFRRFYSARIESVHARINGKKLSPPEEDFTPQYMHKNRCSAWFKLSSISPSDKVRVQKVVEIPTIEHLSDADKDLLQRTSITPDLFGSSDATLWNIEP